MLATLTGNPRAREHLPGPDGSWIVTGPDGSVVAHPDASAA